jgi:hypothetical protein
MSRPSNGADLLPNREPIEIKPVSYDATYPGVTNLRFHFNASSNTLVAKGNSGGGREGALSKPDEHCRHTAAA